MEEYSKSRFVSLNFPTPLEGYHVSTLIEIAVYCLYESERDISISKNAKFELINSCFNFMPSLWFSAFLKLSSQDSKRPQRVEFVIAKNKQFLASAEYCSCWSITFFQSRGKFAFRLSKVFVALVTILVGKLP